MFFNSPVILKKLLQKAASTTYLTAKHRTLIEYSKWISFIGTEPFVVWILCRHTFKAENVVFYSRLVLHCRSHFGKRTGNILDNHKEEIACYNKLVCLVASIGWFVRWIDLLSTSFHFKLLSRVTHRSHGGMIQNQSYLFIFLINKLMCLDSRQVPCNYDAFKIHRIHDKEAISYIAGFSLDRTFNSLYITFNFHLF